MSRVQVAAPKAKSARSAGGATNNQQKKVRVTRKVYNEKHISVFLISICLVLSLFLGSLLYFFDQLHIPDLSNVAAYQPPQASVIYDRNGHIIDKIFVENRTVIPLKAMARNLPKAFVAAEDGRFFEHPGLDLLSVLRAAIKNLKDGAKSQGGSTITQQVAKALLLTPEKTYIRKFKEAILAWRIDQLLSKEEILYIYLNQIYLGEGTHGVEAASQKYFGKSSARLTLGECALLAGLPQAPSKYSLFDHLDRAVERQKYVLNRMAADGYVTAKEAKAAFERPVRLSKGTTLSEDSSGYYMEAVKKQVRSLVGKPLQTAGLHVFTNIDSRLQKEATAAVSRGVHANLGRRVVKGDTKNSKTPQAALVCIETATGRVRASVGGTSFTKSPFDRATQARRPAGSTFKPFVFLAALNQGLTPNSIIEDSPISIRGRDGKTWRPKNYSNKYHGKTTLTDALASSLNAATIRLMQKTGYKDVHNLARKSGINAEMPPDLSLALGAVDVSPLELTSSYQVFAGNGSYIAPSMVSKIVFPDGSVVMPEKERQRVQVMDRGKLSQIQQMLRAVVTSGTGRAVAKVPGVRGGKTGTSDESRDAWFIGYDEKYVTGVWVGYDRNQSLGTGESGGSTAAPIWRDFMAAVKK